MINYQQMSMCRGAWALPINAFRGQKYDVPDLDNIILFQKRHNIRFNRAEIPEFGLAIGLQSQ